jgi:nucleotide-binding universal stress UspA family protein
MSFTKILAATDGSSHGRTATRIAGDLAGRYTAKLLLAHVITDQPVPHDLCHMAAVEHLLHNQEAESEPKLGDLSLTTRSAADERLLAEAVSSELLEQATSLAKRTGAMEIVHMELSGDPAEALITCANRNEVDLVVIGSSGFNRLGRLIHGSVSTKVSQGVRCACLIVK